MDIKIVEEIGRLEKIVEEKYEVFVRDKELISIKIHELQKDIEQGRSKISRTDLYKHQDVLKKEIKDLTRNFMDDRDSIFSKITRLEETKRKIEEDARLGKESIDHNLKNIQDFIDRGNTNEIFVAMEAIKNSITIINNELKLLKKVDDT
jgi:hypothetical protein|tara:strand:+ start:954 stop:1403 length:450 start_codon:yes stop_codon:yes gene_type:complete